MKKIKELVIKGIIKTINKLGCQYEVLNNINENCYVKEYEKNEYIAEYSYCDIFTSDKLYFMDLEFLKNKRIGSIGCILVKNRKIIDEFHLINNNIKFLTKGLEKSIKEGVETVNNEKELFLRFKQFLNKNGNYPIIVWGDDGSYLNKKSIKYNIQFKYIHDISYIITNLISYKGTKLGNGAQLSLSDAKKLYEIEGNVIHEALSDAVDLFNVFNAYINRKEPIMNNDLLNRYFKLIVMKKCKSPLAKIKTNKNYKMTSLDLKFVEYKQKLLSFIGNNINKNNLDMTNKKIIMEDGTEIFKDKIISLNLKVDSYNTAIIIDDRYEIVYDNNTNGLKRLIMWLNKNNK